MFVFVYCIHVCHLLHLFFVFLFLGVRTCDLIRTCDLRRSRSEIVRRKAEQGARTHTYNAMRSDKTSQITRTWVQIGQLDRVIVTSNPMAKSIVFELLEILYVVFSRSCEIRTLVGDIMTLYGSVKFESTQFCPSWLAYKSQSIVQGCGLNLSLWSHCSRVPLKRVCSHVLAPHVHVVHCHEFVFFYFSSNSNAEIKWSSQKIKNEALHFLNTICTLRPHCSAHQIYCYKTAPLSSFPRFLYLVFDSWHWSTFVFLYPPYN